MAYQYYAGQPMPQPGYGYAPQGQLEQLRAAQMYQQVQQAQPFQTAQQGNGIQWVQGEAGAKAYLISPGASVMLMDSEGQSFYIKSADGSGMPMPLRIFDYVERQAQPQAQAMPAQQQAQQAPAEDYATRAELAAVLQKLEGRIDEMERRAPRQPARNTSKEARNDGEHGIQSTQ